MILQYTSTTGDLRAPVGDKPCGGTKIGDYMVKTKQNIVRMIVKVDNSQSSDKVLEGWLVDTQTGYKLSMGKLRERNTSVFTQNMVNPWIYTV